ncbi:serine protease inhibitor Kazal-type 1-like isoform X1 [Nerophis ophidion]|uniref:serine protease inhibitor Kazal-type 1-like isoform X1 n=1 Tax=Nerophis ophidion TaxID=159077 RepID=UPI002AE0A79A|nr:serine protease inhibitor Kazal-type 1-like isoform X1 [Nerophis ophidion]
MVENHWTRATANPIRIARHMAFHFCQGSHDPSPLEAQQKQPTCSDIKGPVLCAMVYNPVCGSDGVTHGNECMLCGKRKSTNQNIWIVKDGPC